MEIVHLLLLSILILRCACIESGSSLIGNINLALNLFFKEDSLSCVFVVTEDIPGGEFRI